MAIKYDTKVAEEKSKESGSSEEYHVTSGYHVVNLVSYAELGRHQGSFKGKPDTYQSGNKAGQIKPDEMFISLVFEFSGAAFTGGFPHAYITSIYNGKEFFNRLSVSETFMENTLSPQYANKTGFKKYLDAINLHYNKNFQGLDEAVGMALAVKVDTLAIYEVDGKKIKCADNAVPGYKKEEAHKNLPGVKYYTTIKPESIVPMVQDFGVTVVDLSSKIVDPVDEYTAVFDWGAPTKADFMGLKSFQKKAIVNATDFRESAFAALVQEDEELQKEVKEARDGSNGGSDEGNAKKSDDSQVPANQGNTDGKTDGTVGGPTGMAPDENSGVPELPV